MSLRKIPAILAGCLVLTACLGLDGSAAVAAPYSAAGSFAAEGGEGVAAEASSGDVFVVDRTTEKVLKLGPEGAVLGEISAVETPQKSFGLFVKGVAVDNSGGPGTGDVYVASFAEGAAAEERPVVDKFAPKAGKPDEYEYVCELTGIGGGCHRETAKEGVTPTNEFGGFGALGVAVGASGDVYVTAFNGGAQVYEFDSAGGDVLSAPLEPAVTFPTGIAVDASGDVYVQGTTGSFKGEEIVEINTKGESSVLDKQASTGVAVNQATGEVFALDSEGEYHVTRYDSTGKEIEQFGAGELGESRGIAYDPKNGEVYVTDKTKNQTHAFAAAVAAPYSAAGSFAAEGGEGVAAEASSGDVFVVDRTTEKVLKLGPEGAVLGEISAVETPQKSFGLFVKGVAVDNSGGPGTGDVYVASFAEGAAAEERPVVDKFAPKAGKPDEYEYVCELTGIGGGCHRETAKEGVTPTNEFGGFGALGVAVGASGDVYVTAFNGGAQVYEFDSAGGDVLSAPLEPAVTFPTGIAVDASGDVYVQGTTGSFKGEEIVEINTKGESSVLDKQASTGVAVNQATGEVFALDSEGEYHVTRYDSTGKEIEQFGAGELGESRGIAYDPKNGEVYVTDKTKNQTHAFAKTSGGQAPEADCTGVPPVEVSATSATLRCNIDPKGEPAGWFFEYKLAGANTFTGLPEATVASAEVVEAKLKALLPQTEYSYRLFAHNKHGPKTSPTESFTTAPAVASVSACAATPLATEATLQASLEPRGGKTEYRFEFGTSPAYGSQTSLQSSESAVPVSASAPVNLEPNRTYDCRLSASTEIEATPYTTFGENGSFKTLALEPALIAQSSEHVTASAATIHATIDPENSPTTYLIEYTPAAEYCEVCAGPYEHASQTATSEVGADISYHTVQQVLEDLAPSTTYDYRVVASNSPEPGTGTTNGMNQTFTTAGEHAPSVTTGVVSGVKPTGAILSGTVSPEGASTIYVFEIGTTEQYGTDVSGALPGAGVEAQSVTLTLTSLAPGTTYHYRLSATNTSGTSYGQDQAFTTPGGVYSLSLPLTPPLIANPSIAFPAEGGAAPVGTAPKALTRGQKLVAALKACRRSKSRRGRAGCEARARKRYGLATQKRRKKKGQKGK